MQNAKSLALCCRARKKTDGKSAPIDCGPTLSRGATKMMASDKENGRRTKNFKRGELLAVGALLIPDSDKQKRPFVRSLLHIYLCVCSG